MFASRDTTLFNTGPRSEDVLGILINICWRAIIGQGCSSYVKFISSSSRQQLCLSFILGWMTDCNPSRCMYLRLYLKKGGGGGGLRHKVMSQIKVRQEVVLFQHCPINVTAGELALYHCFHSAQTLHNIINVCFIQSHHQFNQHPLNADTRHPSSSFPAPADKNRHSKGKM